MRRIWALIRLPSLFFRSLAKVSCPSAQLAPLSGPRGTRLKSVLVGCQQLHFTKGLPLYMSASTVGWSAQTALMQNTHPGAVHGADAGGLGTLATTPPALEIEGQFGLSPFGPSVALQLLASPGVMGIGWTEPELPAVSESPQEKQRTPASTIINALVFIAGSLPTYRLVGNQTSACLLVKTFGAQD